MKFIKNVDYSQTSFNGNAAYLSENVGKNNLVWTMAPTTITGPAPILTWIVRIYFKNV